MRDFRDAKAMGRALRDALKAKAVETTHAEALELIAKAFGHENWNILSAKIEAAAEPPASDERELSVAASRAPEPPPKTLYCSFCGKSQHEVRKLIPDRSGCPLSGDERRARLACNCGQRRNDNRLLAAQRFRRRQMTPA
jgi:hypothetical protein